VVSRFDQGLRIVLRSSEDPRPGPKEILMRVRASSLNGPGKAWRRACAEPPLLREIRDPACAAVTAWVALTNHRRVTAGDTVLTQGSGGVSVFTLQFARILGARVIATTSTAEKAERLKTLGASEVINYAETPDWDEKARELTDGRGVDCTVEIGGPGTIAKSLKALAVGGHVSLIGASLSPAGTMLDPLLLTGRGITAGSISVGSRADFEAMNRAIALHRLRPVIDRTFPFAEAKAAYRHFESRGYFGKVVIPHG
jgi:NADPH:quinone reductase-like Zn-dependent oxidoreductase